MRECVLSFHRVCPRDYNELIRFGGLYLPPHWQGGLLKRRGSFHLPRFPGGGDDFRMTSACRFHLIRKPKNASEAPESRGGCLKEVFILNPLLISLEILI